jgi:predicted esterase
LQFQGQKLTVLKKKDQICWGWNFNDSGVIDSALEVALKTKEQCFPKAKITGLVGFSNGGFVANQITKDCHATGMKWLISIGAGDSQNKNDKNDKSDLSKCTPLVLMAGKKDKFNYESIKELGKWLKDQKAKVTVIEHDDGHTIPEIELETALKSVIPK